jgi:hypothetical protein
MKRLVLAFDIERSGATNEYSTIGFGASVVDEDLNELDTLFVSAYFVNETVFEKRCWDQFWSKNEDKLNVLKYDGELTLKERECEMITLFQAFRSKWEQRAKDMGIEFQLVCDNSIYDGTFVNQLIFNYLPNTLPIPYSASEQQYESFFETYSCQKGFLMCTDPSFNSDWCLFNRISELYDFPKSNKQHDHHPANDAYTIAYEQQILYGIRDGKYHKKSTKCDVASIIKKAQNAIW